MQTLQTTQQSQIFQYSVIVFSKHYMPLTRVNLKRAVVLLVTGQAESLTLDNAQQWQVRSPSIVLQVSDLMNA